MRLDAVPDGPGSAALTDELEAVAHRVGRFIKRLEVDADDVELWLNRRGTWAWRVDGRDLEARMAPRRDTVAIRVYRDIVRLHLEYSLIDETNGRAGQADKPLENNELTAQFELRF